MARPRKENADYFSHDTNMRSHRKVIALRNKFGLEGYAIRCMLLEHIGSCDYFTSTRDEIEIEILAGDFGCDNQLLQDIVGFCHRLKLIDVGEDTLKCAGLTDRLADLVSKRDRERNRVTVAETTQPVAESPQSKVKESKVKETKENYRIVKRKKGLSNLDISVFDNDRLLDEGWTQVILDGVYDSIENYTKNTLYTSLYFTARNRLKKENKPKTNNKNDINPDLLCIFDSGLNK